jgi:GalNAc-alpha-(1->4)-GalNAc-alpha-(1->3)-diNAcBac-PP-undecaprenol alpha-1,4-N-acetyl-D-galactosaminyltransferase
MLFPLFMKNYAVFFIQELPASSFKPKVRQPTLRALQMFRLFPMVYPLPAQVIDSLKTRPYKNLISVGRLIPSKDFSTLLYAFSTVHKTHPDATLTIYGDGEERSNLEKLRADLNLDDCVFFPGIVKNIQEKLVEADLFIFPSRFEGFPNTLCEALAVGLPVIASDCSGNRDVVQDQVNGLLFSIREGAIDKLASLISQLLEDPIQCQRLSTEAKKITDQLSEEKIYRLWDELIKTVAG